MREALALSVAPQPGKSALHDLDPQRLTWFEERFEAAAAAKAALPPVRYAVQSGEGTDIVVCGEQCLAPEVCFTWQRWPAGK